MNDNRNSESARKLDKLWDMYFSGELMQISGDIYELCGYESGINGDGHNGWFFNTEETLGKEGLDKVICSMKTILPAHLFTNLKTAYDSYETANEAETCETADGYFFANEQEIIDILQKYADGLSL